jgi:hypothetical protein
MMKSQRLQFSTLVRIGQSILCAAVVSVLALMAADMYQQRMNPKPDTRTEPGAYYFPDAWV